MKEDPSFKRAFQDYEVEELPSRNYFFQVSDKFADHFQIASSIHHEYLKEIVDNALLNWNTADDEENKD